MACSNSPVGFTPTSPDHQAILARFLDFDSTLLRTSMNDGRSGQSCLASESVLMISCR
jgi:hypothetical protein